MYKATNIDIDKALDTIEAFRRSQSTARFAPERCQ